MNDLDPAIRSHLTRLVDATPMAPSVEDILTRDLAKGTLRRSSYLLAAAILLVVGTIVAVLANGGTGSSTNDVVAGPPARAGEPHAEFAPGVHLGLSTAPIFNRYLATTGSDLLIASNPSAATDWNLRVVGFSDSESLEATAKLNIPVRGILIGFEASGDTVMAIVSRHLESEPPLVVLSKDGGSTWTEYELPWPKGQSGPDAYASSGAIGGERLLVVGNHGVWVSDTGEEWRYVDISAGARLTAVSWDGTQFVLGGGIQDATAPNGSDDDVVFWRSNDGLEWSGVDEPGVHPALRTSDGVGQLVSNTNGLTLAITTTQLWVDGRPDAETRGTLVATSEDGKPFVATHLPDWLFYNAAVTPWGFITSAHSIELPLEPRLLGSADGIRWIDIGPAPALMESGTSWLGGVAINGPAQDNSQETSAWYLPPITKIAVARTTIPTTVPPIELPPQGDRDLAAEQRLLDGLALGRWRTPEEAAESMAIDQEILAKQELFTQACMAEAGFDYFFDPPENQLRLDTNFEGDFRSPDWYEQYGFGVSTLMYTQAELGPDLVGTLGPFAGPFPLSPDRTSQQLETTTADKVVAYQRALTGYARSEGDVRSEETFAPSCRGQARDAHTDQSNLIYLEWPKVKVDELRQRIEADPQIQGLLQDGAACVAEQGFEITEESEAILEISRQTVALFDLVPPDPSNPEFLSRLASIQTYELGLANTLRKCGITLEPMAPYREDAALRWAYEMGILG